MSFKSEDLKRSNTCPWQLLNHLNISGTYYIYLYIVPTFNILWIFFYLYFISDDVSKSITSNVNSEGYSKN